MRLGRKLEFMVSLIDARFVSGVKLSCYETKRIGGNSITPLCYDLLVRTLSRPGDLIAYAPNLIKKQLKGPGMANNTRKNQETTETTTSQKFLIFYKNQ